MIPICHFDIPAEDLELIKRFYGGVFGWTFEHGEGASDSWSIGFSSQGQSESMTGGIIPRSAPTQPIGCHFVVPSIDQAAVNIQEFGGIVFVPKTAVPGKGYYACCFDPENNYFIIWENDMMAE